MASQPGLRCLTSFAAAALALLVCASPVTATHRGEGVVDTVSVQVSFRTATVAGARDQVVARLTMDDGSPIAAVEVTFWREVYFVGERRIRIGSALTDASGTAGVPYSGPAEAERFVAEFAGNTEFMPASAIAWFNVPAHPGRPDGDPAGGPESTATLAVFASFMPPLLASIAFSVWLLILGLTARTVFAIRRGRQTTT
jgi:hypothetical protein